MKQNSGTLYIVATPIGNLEDMTQRAIRILKQVDLVAAEDTRHTRKLLTHFSITTALISYYREREAEKSKELVNKLLSGQNVALVSDAGTPGISDPGSTLVRAARNNGISIVPVPGPSAFVAALSCAGLNPGSFIFLGFPPAKRGERRTLLQSLATTKYPIVLYESPHRIQKLIHDACELLGDRTILWAREITKKFEEIKQTTLEELSAALDGEKIRGEIVLVIHPDAPLEIDKEHIDDILGWYLDNTDLSMKDVCKKVSEDLGVSRSEVYKKALFIWKKR